MTKLVSYDVETTGLRRHEHEIFSYSTFSPDWDAAQVCRLDGPSLNRSRNQFKLQQLWRNTSIAKTMHNMKFDIGFTMKHLDLSTEDIQRHELHCTMLMSLIVRNDHPGHSLKRLSWDVCGYPQDDDKAVRTSVGAGENYSHVPEHLMNRYQVADAERAMLLYQFFHPMIQRNPKHAENYRWERDLVFTTIRMEDRGVMLNASRCNRKIQDLRNKLTPISDRIANLLGRRINPSSNDQIRHVLYNVLDMPVLKTTKKGNQPSVDKEVLKELHERYPKVEIFNLIQEYRSYVGGIGIFHGYLKRADSDGVLHPNIMPNGAQATRRESCSDPNLQNVQKSQGLLNPYPVPAREVFRPRPGYVHIHVDFSGIEMRLLVHYAQEAELVEIIRTGGDVHKPAAEMFYGDRFTLAEPKDAKVLRSTAKNGHFALAYGSSGTALAKTLGVSSIMGVQAHRRYKERFPSVVGLMMKYIRQVKDCGYVETEFGTRLYISCEEAYKGINALIQGTAAEIMKRSQVCVDRYLKKATSDEVRCLLPIHDELIIEFPRKRLSSLSGVLRDIQKEMTTFPGAELFRVPLGVEFEMATLDWAHKKEIRQCNSY